MTWPQPKIRCSLSADFFFFFPVFAALLSSHSEVVQGAGLHSQLQLKGYWDMPKPDPVFALMSSVITAPGQKMRFSIYSIEKYSSVASH